MDGTPRTHAEFVERARREPFWTISDPRRAFRLAWGAPGEFLFWLQHAVCILVPLGLLGYVCVTRANYWLSAWAPVAVWTSLASSRTVIGLLPALVLVVVVGLPLSFMLGQYQIVAALSPVCAFAIALPVKALVARSFLQRLVTSPASWERVSNAGLLREG